MKTVVDPELAVAHLVFKVADLKRSCEFYSNLGIPPFAIDGEESHLLNCVGALIFYCQELISWLEET